VRFDTPCAFPPCPRQGVETLSLEVGGTQSVLLACPRHAEWLRAYAEEDADVEFLDPALFAHPPVA